MKKEDKLRPKTLDNTFFDDEIKHISYDAAGNPIIYLHDNVRRKLDWSYYSTKSILEDDINDESELLSTDTRIADKLRKYKQELKDEENYN
jgi:hypothetical protein